MFYALLGYSLSGLLARENSSCVFVCVRVYVYVCTHVPKFFQVIGLSGTKSGSCEAKRKPNKCTTIIPGVLRCLVSLYLSSSPQNSYTLVLYLISRISSCSYLEVWKKLCMLHLSISKSLYNLNVLT